VNKREVILRALRFERVPYVPWQLSFTVEAAEKLGSHFGTSDLDTVLDNHFVDLGSSIGFFEDQGEARLRDVFGVVWNRTIDRDIGNVEGCVLPEPALDGFKFPDPLDSRFFADIPAKLDARGDCFRRFCIGFSLFERAWTLRGMENLLLDMMENPGFVHELLGRIADYNIAQAREAMRHDIDCVHFGDDWGQQRGLIMGAGLWREFIKPQLARMYGAVRAEGKIVSIHSCGDVDELFDDLVELGVTLFNPFQPEVMDVHALMRAYRQRLAFHGGLSMQRTLPYGTPDDVRAESRSLIGAGAEGGYVFSPSHAVEGDVPLNNMLAFVEVLKKQPGYANA
jgi:uroporphyrinogen decarboxylase